MTRLNIIRINTSARLDPWKRPLRLGESSYRLVGCLSPQRRCNLVVDVQFYIAKYSMEPKTFEAVLNKRRS